MRAKYCQALEAWNRIVLVHRGRHRLDFLTGRLEADEMAKVYRNRVWTGTMERAVAWTAYGQCGEADMGGAGLVDCASESDGKHLVL